MPYFLRHYSTLAEKIIIYDQQSDDGTREIVKAHRLAELRDYPYSTGLDDMTLTEFASEAYKEARGRADWVMWVDADEFVYNSDMPKCLIDYRAQGVDVVAPAGFSMVADNPPCGDGQIYAEILHGIPDKSYSKPVVINPSADVAWGAGKHHLLSGAPHYDTGALKLLHYRCLGEAWLLARDNRNFSRMSEENKARGLGWQVHPEPSKQHAAQMETFKAQAVRLSL